MEKQIETIMHSHGFPKIEWENVFEAMSEILEVAAKNMQKRLPDFSTNHIDKFREVSVAIQDMDLFIKTYK